MEEIYEKIRAEACPDTNGDIQVKIYGSVSQYPFLVVPNLKAVRRLNDFLADVLKKEDEKTR